MRPTSRIPGRPSFAIRAFTASFPKRSMKRFAAVLSEIATMRERRSRFVGVRPGSNSSSIPEPAATFFAVSFQRSVRSSVPSASRAAASARRAILMTLAASKLSDAFSSSRRPLSTWSATNPMCAPLARRELRDAAGEGRVLRRDMQRRGDRRAGGKGKEEEEEEEEEDSAEEREEEEEEEEKKKIFLEGEEGRGEGEEGRDRRSHPDGAARLHRAAHIHLLRKTSFRPAPQSARSNMRHHEPAEISFSLPSSPSRAARRAPPARASPPSTCSAA